MIDLTPLDVRNKRGDFKKLLRGYDPQEVDVFLELVAERLDQLVMENLRLRERTENLERQVESSTGREKAVQEALVTAQELRSEMRKQAEREAELILNEARTEARRVAAEAEADAKGALRDAERRLLAGKDTLEELERRRMRFLKQFRQLLERELDVVQVEEERAPLEDQAIDLELGGGRSRAGDEAAREARAALESQFGSSGAAEDVAAPSPEAADDAARPSLDAPIDRLAAEHAAGAPDDTLSLSLDDAPADDDEPRLG